MSDRVRRHVAAFNTAVESGDWSDFATRFTEGARMTFVGVPAGPFAGRDAIAEAYQRTAQQLDQLPAEPSADT